MVLLVLGGQLKHVVVGLGERPRCSGHHVGLLLHLPVAPHHLLSAVGSCPWACCPAERLVVKQTINAELNRGTVGELPQDSFASLPASEDFPDDPLATESEPQSCVVIDPLAVVRHPLRMKLWKALAWL